MAICVSNPKYTGRQAALYWVAGCGDARPDAADYKLVGAVNTKGFNLSGDEVDATADDTVGGIKETLVTYANYEVTADGKCRNGDGTASSHAELLTYWAGEMNASRQPGAWVKLVFPDLTFEAFCVITDPGSRSASDTDTATFTFAAKATASDFGLIVEPTV